jgi:hypothetical protein
MGCIEVKAKAKMTPKTKIKAILASLAGTLSVCWKSAPAPATRLTTWHGQKFR